MNLQFLKGYKFIEGQNFSRKTVVVRTDYDVPLEDGEVADSTKIQASLETIKYLLEQNAKIIIVSHLGEPNGEENDELSLMSVRFELGRLLCKPVKFAHIHACTNSIKFMEFGEILLLENLKFHAEETSTDKNVRKDFMSVLVGAADYFIDEAFGIDQDLASMSELSAKLKTFKGQNYKKELEVIDKYINGASPRVSIIGGANLETRLELIDSIINYSDKILLGGLVAILFLAAQSIEVGGHKFHSEYLFIAKQILNKAQDKNVEILLPIDHLAGSALNTAELTEIHTQSIPDNLLALDIGQNTLALFREIIESAGTILWSGPVGYYENELANKGTEAIGEYIALSTSKTTFRYAVGASTSLAMTRLKIKHKRFSHVSLGTSKIFDILKNNKI